MSADAPPVSPERLHVLALKTKWDGDCVEVTMRLRYEPWCCDGAHELTDAATATQVAIETSVENAWRDRQKAES